MKRAEWLQETRKMGFEEAYGGWQGGPLPQEEAAQLAFQLPVLVAFCLRTINLRTICESSRFFTNQLESCNGVYIAAECY